MKNLKLKITSRGIVAMSTVLVIAAVLVVISITVTYLSIGEAQSGLNLFKGEDSLTFAEGCVEDVMLKIRSSSTFSGTSILRPEGTCSITYNPGGSGPTNWDLTVSSSSTAYQRKIQVIFTRSSTGITLTSWKEI